jgi:hypothetical protein
MPDDPQSLERAARDSLEERYGRPLSDDEWASAKYALLELGKVLRDWKSKAGQRAA